jgi:hypothetical protein
VVLPGQQLGSVFLEKLGSARYRAIAADFTKSAGLLLADDER